MPVLYRQVKKGVITAAYLGKYHIALDGEGYILSHNARGNKYYQKKKAPMFVNKFGGGDASYKDASFWQFWAITNWRNGAKQLRVDDGGKFWKSQNVDTTQLEELTLSRALTSIGQLPVGVEANCFAAWRASSNWWNANYQYRQQITITAPASQQIPAGYPINISIDTAALQTATKVRADRNDWRVVYFNGSSWVELIRDYVSTTSTFFAIQTAIAAGATDNNYYVYYGYASEATSKQPSTEADFNGIYGMFGITPDTNSKAIYHMREGSGNTLNDDSSGSNNGSITGATWETIGLLGRNLSFSGNTQYVDLGNGSDFNLGSFTLEALIYVNAASIAGRNQIIAKWNISNTNRSYTFGVEGGKLQLYIEDGSPGGAAGIVSNATLSGNTWYWVAATYDGSVTAKLYINGALDKSQDLNKSVLASTTNVYIGQTGDSGDRRWFNGKIQHVRISNIVRDSFQYALATATVSYGTETTTQPPSSTFELHVGGDNGILYKWDGNSTFTEQFDARRITWYDSGYDADIYVGDQGGTERIQAQSFQLSEAMKIKGLELYLKKANGTPGDITVRIETDNSGKPSGTLADANLTYAIPAFTTSTYSWVAFDFATVSAALAKTTTYWIVVKIAAGPNDNNYAWGADSSSPSYSSGNVTTSTDGGTTYSASAGIDAYFRIKGETTTINDLLVSSVGGTQKMLIATGSISSQVNGDARLFSFDGSAYALEKTFATATESQITKLYESAVTGKLYAGVGPQAKVYEGTAPNTWTLSKRIPTPQNPGYIYSIKDYGGRLNVLGGSPEFLYDKNYNGFWYQYDGTTWTDLYPFTFTVLRSAEFYDSFLFAGTYRGDVFVYDMASLNPLFNFKDDYHYQQIVQAMQQYDDKIYILLNPQTGSGDTNAAIWRFDRHGMSCAHLSASVTGFKCATVVNNLLIVGTNNRTIYKIDPNTYETQGWSQSSYFDAGLPSLNKLYNSVTIQHDPLVSGQSIKLYYKFKESDAWTLLGTSSTVAAESATFTFASGTYSKKISFKTEINTSDTSKTPRVTEQVLQYALYPDVKWMWTMRIYAKSRLTLLDRTKDTHDADDIRTNIEAAINSKELLTFIDVNGTSYSVMFAEIDQSSWVVNQATENEDEILISLLEA